MGKLNPKKVENLTEPGTYEDGDGLRLVVKATGRKSWLLRFQLAGRRREMGLGSYPEVSLKSARLEANTKRRHLIDGVDPLAARDLERAVQREALRAHEATVARQSPVRSCTPDRRISRVCLLVSFCIIGLSHLLNEPRVYSNWIGEEGACLADADFVSNPIFALLGSTNKKLGIFRYQTLCTTVKS